METKTCKACSGVKPLGDFPEYRSQGKVYQRTRCLECHRKEDREAQQRRRQEAFNAGVEALPYQQDDLISIGSVEKEVGIDRTTLHRLLARLNIKSYIIKRFVGRDAFGVSPTDAERLKQAYAALFPLVCGFKLCRKCGLKKTISEFYRKPDGFCRSYCRACNKVLSDAWRDAHPDYGSHYMKVYQVANRSRRLAYSKQYRAARPEWCRAARQRNYYKHQEARITEAHRQRAKRRNAPGSHTEAEWRAVRQKYGNVCLSCGKAGPLTRDHIVPISKGGSNDITNIQPLCPHCNFSKFTKTIDYRPA